MQNKYQAKLKRKMLRFMVSPLKIICLKRLIMFVSLFHDYIITYVNDDKTHGNYTQTGKPLHY